MIGRRHPVAPVRLVRHIGDGDGLADFAVGAQEQAAAFPRALAARVGDDGVDSVPPDLHEV